MKTKFLKLKYKVLLLCLLTLPLLIGCEKENLQEMDTTATIDESYSKLPKEFLMMNNQDVVINSEGDIISYFDQNGDLKDTKGNKIMSKNPNRQAALVVFYSGKNYTGRSYTIRANSGNINISVQGTRVPFQANSAIVAPAVALNWTENGGTKSFEAQRTYPYWINNYPWPQPQFTNFTFEVSMTSPGTPQSYYAGNLCGFAYDRADFSGRPLPVFARARYGTVNARDDFDATWKNKIKSYRVQSTKNACKYVFFSLKKPPNHANGNLDNKRRWYNNRSIRSFANNFNGNLNGKIAYVETGAENCGQKRGMKFKATKNQVKRFIRNAYKASTKASALNGKNGMPQKDIATSMCKMGTTTLKNIIVGTCRLIKGSVGTTCFVGGAAYTIALSRRIPGAPHASQIDLNDEGEMNNWAISVALSNIRKRKKVELIGAAFFAVAVPTTLYADTTCDEWNEIWQEEFETWCK